MALLKNKYMPLSEANVSPERVATYDGQRITLSSTPDTAAFVMGNYLGGGIAGVVYEAFDQRMKRPVAVKILNPVGYKLTTPGALRRAEIVKPGVPILGHVRGMTLDNVYWVHLPHRRELLACYVTSTPLPVLRELTLEMCVSLWLVDHDDDAFQNPPLSQRRRRPRTANQRSTSEEPVQEFSQRSVASASVAVAASARPVPPHNRDEDDSVVMLHDVSYVIPQLPAKYRAFLQARQTIYREIAHMHKLTGNTITGERLGSGHANVLQLYDVLELIQPSKSTIFLVLELAYGGELFDRIRGDTGVDETVARTYFKQLLSGVRYCHQLGIVHRDLKPENLLLSEADVLKIADFGLSAHYIAAVSSGTSGEDREHHSETTLSTGMVAPSRFRRLNSMVGSPHYVAPEVLSNARYGYDGRKADMWSIGVILYGLLVGSLPFGRELTTCPRYLKFSEWLRSLPCDSHTNKLVYDSNSYQSGSPASLSKFQVPDLALTYSTISASRALMRNNSNCISSTNSSVGWCSSLASGTTSSSLGPEGSNGITNRRSVVFPTWFFPVTLSPRAAFLLASLLHPDPNKRISCEEACKSSWVLEV